MALRPNPASYTYIPLSDRCGIYIKNYFSSVYAVADGKVEYISFFKVNGWVKEYDRRNGTSYAMKMWASDERAGWNVIGDELVIDVSGSKFRADFNKVISIILKNYYKACNYMEWKFCSSCPFTNWWDRNADRLCLFGKPYMRPVREMLHNDLKNYVERYFYVDCGLANFGLWLGGRLNCSMDDVVKELSKYLEKEREKEDMVLFKVEEYSDRDVWLYDDICIYRNGELSIEASGSVDVFSKEDLMYARDELSYMYNDMLKMASLLSFASNGMLSFKYHGEYSASVLRSFTMYTELISRSIR